MPFKALPEPMLARAESTLPVGDYAFEVKWDGFRAVVSTEDGFHVRSRRGWNMAPLIPELARKDVRGVFDGELIGFQHAVGVASGDGAPKPLIWLCG
jgi:ATP-dependent DNA ligase